ncbi:MAG TPA: hypothetical protein VG621_01620 [Candidatus Paceibacterota bacterium]|nr:hypothetical protein [Candidatus Paceibacterota bacterium]
MKKLTFQVVAIGAAIILALIFKATAQTPYYYEISSDTVYNLTKTILYTNAPANLSQRVINSLNEGGSATDTAIVVEQMNFPLGIFFKKGVMKIMRYEVDRKRIDVSEVSSAIVYKYSPNIAILIVLAIALVLSWQGVDSLGRSKSYLKKHPFWDTVGDFFNHSSFLDSTCGSCIYDLHIPERTG